MRCCLWVEAHEVSALRHAISKSCYAFAPGVLGIWDVSYLFADSDKPPVRRLGAINGGHRVRTL